MKPAGGQPRLPRPYQDDYAYCTHDLKWWTRGSDLGVALGQAGTCGNDTPTLNKPHGVLRVVRALCGSGG